MDVKRYLKRLNLEGSIVPDLENLRKLQRAHMLNVPFENIDVHYGIPVEYSLESFYRKIVVRNRGGYCYELNGLFHCLLTSLGYDAALVSGLVVGKKDFVTEFEHVAILVDVEDRKWLVDVGFGDGPLTPLLLAPGRIQKDHYSENASAGNNYRIVDDVVIDGKRHFGLERWNRKTEAFVALYYFTLERRNLNYFMMMHEYQELVPTAYYKGSLICSLPTFDGRVSIINNRLIETKNGVKNLSTIRNGEEQERLLRDLFNIDISVGEVAKMKGEPPHEWR
jgi:N-hydroxyarylamine O-acetyltransferase